MIGGGRCAEKHNPSETEGWIMDVSYIQMYVSSIWIDIKIIRCGLESYVAEHPNSSDLKTPLSN